VHDNNGRLRVPPLDQQRRTTYDGMLTYGFYTQSEQRFEVSEKIDDPRLPFEMGSYFLKANRTKHCFPPLEEITKKAQQMKRKYPKVFRLNRGRSKEDPRHRLLSSDGYPPAVNRLGEATGTDGTSTTFHCQ